MTVNFIREGKGSTRRKPQTCRKSLNYMLWLSFPYVEYTFMTLSHH